MKHKRTLTEQFNDSLQPAFVQAWAFAGLVLLASVVVLVGLFVLAVMGV